ncbi:MAG: DUF1002 domain-containing protein [Lachnospiraceae bacterium]|nr:DUF1002 domain-containing protein [Lachnospiraceae bacterium]
MKKTWTKVQALLLAALMLVMQTGIVSTAHADAVAFAKVVTLGADLSAEEKESILQFFGVKEEDVKVITITNQDERDMLGLLIPIEQIGTHTYSCAMVSPTVRGGIQVKTANMNYVTSNMIAATLSTSGVVNCDVLTAAPFMVSGTGALTGTMMAYETASGETLDPAKKELANEELVTTEELADEIGQEEATLVVNDIKIRIIRDQVKEEAQVHEVVDDVVDTMENAMEEREAAGGQEAAKISDGKLQNLYSFGAKVSQQDYQYDDMKVTLQRVTENVTEAAGIEDPITETFEDLSEESELADDSILRETDDEALGEDSNVNTTSKSAVTAEAQNTTSVSLEQTAVVAGAEQIIDRNVIFDGSRLYDLNGEPLSAARYSATGAMEGGYIAVQTDAGYGVIAEDGTELVPAQYDAVLTGNRFWQSGIMLKEGTETDYDLENDGSYYKLEKVDVYFIEQQKAEKVAELTGEEVVNFRTSNRYLSIQDRSGSVTIYNEKFEAVAEGLSELGDTADVPGMENIGYDISSVNGQAVVTSADGTQEIKTGYKYVDRVNGDGIRVNDGSGNGTGLLDFEGNTILPAKFKSVELNYSGPYLATETSNYSARGYYAVRDAENKLCYAVKGGAVVYETGFDYSELTVNGASATYKDADGRTHIIAADGVDTALPETISGCYALPHADGMLYRYYDESQTYSQCLVDWHGELLWTGNGTVRMSGNGEYLTISDSSAVTVFKAELPKAPEMEAVDDGRTAAAELEAVGDLPYVTGVTITEETTLPKASQIRNSDNFWVRDPESDSRAYALGAADGSLLTDYAYDSSVYVRGEYGILEVRTDAGWNAANGSGELLTEQTYDVLEVPKEAWLVGYKLKSTTKEEETDFTGTSDAKYTITQADIYHVENGSASLVASLKHDEVAKIDAFDNERIGVCGRDGKWSVYDSSFNAMVTDQDEKYDAESLSDLQNVGVNGQQGLSAYDGTEILPPTYKNVYNYLYDGKYVPVSDGDKTGLIDLEGHLVLPLLFDSVERNYDAIKYLGNYAGYDNLGYFAVVKDGKICYAVASGEVTCETGLEKSELDIEGAAAAKENGDGTFTLFAADGVQSEITAEDLSVCERSCGMLWYGENEDGKSTLYDWHGTVLLEDYDDYHMTYSHGYLAARNGDEITICRVDYEGMDELNAEAHQSSGNNGTAALTRESDSASGSYGAVKKLINSALKIMSSDYEVNASSAASMLKKASGKLTDAGEESAASLLDSAVTLLESGSGDAASVEALLDTVLEMLG